MVTPPGKDKWLRSSQVVQWVKDPASSLQQLGSLLWLGLSTPSLETIACCGCDQKEKKKKVENTYLPRVIFHFYSRLG